MLAGGIALLSLSAAGCAIEVGPPPESDPPLLPESARTPPPPQPTEPQAWSRDLDFESGPAKIDRDVLAEGLVASKPEVAYSRERLTFESALDAEKPPSEAELARQRARERAAAAGLPPPPEVNAAPVASVTAQTLPPAGGAAATAAPRESSLLPAPSISSAPAQDGEAPAAADTDAPAEQAAATPAPQAPDSASRWRDSRLPPPPKFLAQLAATEEPAASGDAAKEESGGAAEATREPGSQPAQAEVLQTPAAAAQVAKPPVVETPVAATEAAALPPSRAAAAAAGPADPDDQPVTSGAPKSVAAARPAATSDDPATAAFLAEAWDAPAGTILVQVSAVAKPAKVTDEWARLRDRYPEVLKPLRLVVDEAKLGDRGVFYRVQAGAFGSQEGAIAACDSLINQGQACFVVVR